MASQQTKSGSYLLLKMSNFNLKNHKIAVENRNLIFVCTSCGTSAKLATSCSKCNGTLFKVSRFVTEDVYRTKEYSPEDGQQFTNTGGEGTSSSSIGGPNTRPEQSDINGNPDGRPLPSDGGEGDFFPEDANSLGLLPDNSPLRQKTKPRDINVFNTMHKMPPAMQDDPYEAIRKRKFR